MALKPKLIRITTVPISLRVLLKGQPSYMQKNGFEVVAVSSSGEQLEEVNKIEGVRIEAIEMSRAITPFKDLKSLWRFYQFCKKEKPQIVHSHTPKAGIVAMLGARLAKVPIRLHTVAGLPLMEASGFKRRILDFVEKMTYKSATHVYPNSKKLYEFILENDYAPQHKLKVLANGSSNGIDTDYFSLQQVSEEEQRALKDSLNITPNDFVFVFIGRLVGDKGINELVRAFDKIGSKLLNKTPKLLLVGPLESELDPLLSHTVQVIKTNPNVITLGFQKDVRPYFAISDALTFPSYREGFPNVVMQAGAMGLPSIVTDINGCNEIIKSGQNGLIIPVKDEMSLGEAMLELMQNEDLYNNLTSNARNMIQSRFEQDTVWNAILEEYKEVLSILRQAQ